MHLQIVTICLSVKHNIGTYTQNNSEETKQMPQCRSEDIHKKATNRSTMCMTTDIYSQVPKVFRKDTKLSGQCCRQNILVYIILIPGYLC